MRKVRATAGATVEMIRRVYALGIKPDWWKLAPPEDPAGWRLIEDAIAEADPLCRGVVLLGFDAPLAELEASFAAAARAPICKGFAIGRSIFGQPAEEWLAGKIDDDGAVAAMAARLWPADRDLAQGAQARDDGSRRERANR